MMWFIEVSGITESLINHGKKFHQGFFDPFTSGDTLRRATWPALACGNQRRLMGGARRHLQEACHPFDMLPGNSGPMTDSLTFRPAIEPDLPEVLRLYAQPDMDDAEILPLADATQIWARMAAYPNYKLYVALQGTQVVGTLALLIMDNLGHLGAPSAVVEDVAVDPAWQGHGIGKAMLRHAIALAAQSGCYKLALSSNLKREKAHAFYDSLEFERHGYSFRIHV